MDHLLPGRTSEVSSEVGRKLTRTLIAHRLSRNRDVSLFCGQQPPGLKESQILLVPDRRTTRECMKVSAKSSGRHVYGIRKRIGFNVFAVMFPN